ncbi:MAG TPA: hypothetical protein PLY94_02690 [Gemmatimonadaceae bacterium]|nr:hypothetical protein [Gemmatimonadaceae bacterium]
MIPPTPAPAVVFQRIDDGAVGGDQGPRGVDQGILRGARPAARQHGEGQGEDE